VACRFDVTTDISYKAFADYERYMGMGSRYKVALLDQRNFEIIDIYDLAFRKCGNCNGYKIPCIVLFGQNYSSSGESQWTNDKLLIDICTGCNDWYERQRFTHHWLLSPQEYCESLGDNERADEAPKQHCLAAYKYFRREFDDFLMAVAQHAYVTTDRDGDGHWAIEMLFRNRAVEADLPLEVKCSFQI